MLLGKSDHLQDLVQMCHMNHLLRQFSRYHHQLQVNRKFDLHHQQKQYSLLYHQLNHTNYHLLHLLEHHLHYLQDSLVRQVLELQEVDKNYLLELYRNYLEYQVHLLVSMNCLQLCHQLHHKFDYQLAVDR